MPSEGPFGLFGAVICFELTFPELPRALRRSGADMLVVLSNDAWLGAGAAPSQHFAHAALRAVENRMPVVRSANTGISGIVDPLGQVVTRTESFEETFAVAVTHRATVLPLALHLGGLGGPVAAMALALSLVAVRRRQEGSLCQRRN